jgi:hypothetical protein
VENVETMDDCRLTPVIVDAVRVEKTPLVAIILDPDIVENVIVNSFNVLLFNVETFAVETFAVETFAVDIVAVEITALSPIREEHLIEDTYIELDGPNLPLVDVIST